MPPKPKQPVKGSSFVPRQALSTRIPESLKVNPVETSSLRETLPYPAFQEFSDSFLETIDFLPTETFVDFDYPTDWSNIFSVSASDLLGWRRLCDVDTPLTVNYPESLRVEPKVVKSKGTAPAAKSDKPQGSISERIASISAPDSLWKVACDSESILPCSGRQAACTQTILSIFDFLLAHRQSIRSGYLLWDNIFPQVGNVPLYNPRGKYVVRIWERGCWQAVVVDDHVPFVKSSSGSLEPIFPLAADPYQIWPFIICKALHKKFPGCNDFGLLVSALTGWTQLEPKEYKFPCFSAVVLPTIERAIVAPVIFEQVKIAVNFDDRWRAKDPIAEPWVDVTENTERPLSPRIAGASLLTFVERDESGDFVISTNLDKRLFFEGFDEMTEIGSRRSFSKNLEISSQKIKWTDIGKPPQVIQISDLLKEGPVFMKIQNPLGLANSSITLSSVHIGPSVEIYLEQLNQDCRELVRCSWNPLFVFDGNFSNSSDRIKKQWSPESGRWYRLGARGKDFSVYGGLLELWADGDLEISRDMTKLVQGPMTLFSGEVPADIFGWSVFCRKVVKPGNFLRIFSRGSSDLLVHLRIAIYRLKDKIMEPLLDRVNVTDFTDYMIPESLDECWVVIVDGVLPNKPVDVESVPSKVGKGKVSDAKSTPQNFEIFCCGVSEISSSALSNIFTFSGDGSELRERIVWPDNVLGFDCGFRFRVKNLEISSPPIAKLYIQKSPGESLGLALEPSAYGGLHRLKSLTEFLTQSVPGNLNYDNEWVMTIPHVSVNPGFVYLLESSWDGQSCAWTLEISSSSIPEIGQDCMRKDIEALVVSSWGDSVRAEAGKRIRNQPLTWKYLNDQLASKSIKPASKAPSKSKEAVPLPERSIDDVIKQFLDELNGNAHPNKKIVNFLKDLLGIQNDGLNSCPNHTPLSDRIDFYRNRTIKWQSEISTPLRAIPPQPERDGLNNKGMEKLAILDLLKNSVFTEKPPSDESTIQAHLQKAEDLRIHRLPGGSDIIKAARLKLTTFKISTEICEMLKDFEVRQKTSDPISADDLIRLKELENQWKAAIDQVTKLNIVMNSEVAKKTEAALTKMMTPVKGKK